MSDFPARVRWNVLARSFAVQASWNYRTLIGTGFAFVLLPGLRYLARERGVPVERLVERHLDVFNSHPYLAPLAAGAVLRMEADGVEPDTIARFKAALRGSLGSFGDRLFWVGWRPMCALLGIVVLLAGAPWWAGALTFLVVYNALHLAVRVWGFRAGLQQGLMVAAAVRRSPFSSWVERSADAGALLSGACGVLAVGHAQGGEIGVVPAALALGAGLAFGLRIRPLAAFVIVAAWLWIAAQALIR